MKKGRTPAKRTTPRARPLSGTRKKASRKKPAKRGERPRWVLMLWTIFVVAGGVALTFWWRGSAVSQGVEIVGAQHAQPAVLASMVSADSGSAYYDIDLRLVEDRVERHPWVEDARALRRTDMVLAVEVTERTPALLVIDAGGQASHYLDAEGYQMPYVPGAVYDVPLLRGFNAEYHPVQPIEDPAVLELLAVLPELEPEVDALLSMFNVRPDGTLELDTTPAPGRGSIQVRLGKEGFATRLGRLHAFWQQRILGEQDVRFETIDLRYSSQIITREAPLGQ